MDVNRQPHPALVAAVTVGALLVFELMSMVTRWEPVTADLPFRVIAAHLLFFIPSVVVLWIFAKYLSNRSRSAQTAGWMSIFAILIAGSGDSALNLPVFIAVCAGVVAASFWIDRALGSRSVPGAWGVVLSVFLASALAKGSLLKTGGWQSYIAAAAWFAAAAGLAKLAQIKRGPGWAKTGMVLLIAAIVVSFAGSIGPKSAKPVFPNVTPRNDPNILLVVIDTVRGDAVFPSSEIPSKMPRLVSFAEKHGTWMRITAPSPSSLPTHASLFTGLPSFAHGAHRPFHDDPNPPTYAYALDDRNLTLAEVLREHGYLTAAVSGNYGPLDPVFGLSQGFHFYDAVRNGSNRLIKKTLLHRFAPVRDAMERLPFPLFGYNSATPYRTGDVILKQCKNVLDTIGDKPFLLFVNLFDCHSPYLPPDYWSIKRHADNPDWMREGEPLPEVHDAVVFGGIGLKPHQKNLLDALYNSQLEYVDSRLEKLLNMVDLQNTLVIILSDHGESLGERSMLKHSTTLYSEQVDIPLVIAVPPGIPFPNPLSEKLHDLLDVHDFILNVAGITPPSKLPVPGVVSEVYSAQHPRYSDGRRVVFSGDVRALVRDSMKLMVSSDGVRQLYDLKNDPGETVDIVRDHSELADAMEADLMGYLSNFKRESTDRYSPDLNDSEKESLRVLGYIQ